MKRYKILAKFPTRWRPQIFLSRLKEYVHNANDLKNILFLISYDADDETMTSDVIIKAQTMHPELNIKLVKGHSKSKIEAVNADINNLEGEDANWDIVLVISDDMKCMAKGWDDVIRKKMRATCPDTDHYLFFCDGYQDRLSTIACMGRAYYNRFGYIYHPSYKSLFADNEATEVAQQLGKITLLNVLIMKHQHHSWGGEMAKDRLYDRNDALWSYDEMVYTMRRQAGFPKI